MADTPRDNIYGYDQVMMAVRAKIRPTSSPQTWLAQHLDVTRQSVHHWAASDGIPDRHVPAVMKLTGLSAVEIRPQDIATKIPGSLFDEIARQAEAKKVSFPARLIAVIRAGLHLNP